jgi:GNAT superfamily N-acetyltransferase
MPPTACSIHPAKSAADWRAAARLFRAYARSLDFELCFQGFDRELADLRTQYGPPTGMLLLVFLEGRAVGCAGIRRFHRGVCELKRMYLINSVRGRGLGRRLAEESLRAAGTLGYRRLRLDTLARMTEAVALYRSLGFRRIPPYRPNPLPDALYLEHSLSCGGVRHQPLTPPRKVC